MLEATIIMDSSVEEVIAFKCCNLPDQNLEIHLRNTGDRSLTIPGFFILENATETKRIDNVYPPGDLHVPPGELVALYCQMDSAEWDRYRTITFCDAGGSSFSFLTQRWPSGR